MTTSPGFEVLPADNGSHIYQAHNHCSQVLGMLEQCWRQYPELCDATILVEDQQFAAHKVALMACSSFFKELYLPDGRWGAESLQEKLEELTPAIFHIFLEFAYTGKLDLSMRTVAIWLKIGHVLEVAMVKAAACEYLKHQTNADNCMDIITIAEKFNLAEVKHLANREMCERLIQLSQSLRERDLEPDDGEMSSEGDGEVPAADVQSKTRVSPRKQPPKPVRQARYHQAAKNRKAVKRPTRKNVSLRTRKTEKLAEPRTPSQRILSLRQRALKAKQNAIEVVTHANKVYPCKFCDVVCSKHSELQSHYRNEHAKCVRCRKVFRHPDELTKHAEAHRRREENANRVRSYVCPYCGKNCNVNSALKIHIRTHTGEKPYQCDLCPARFIQSINLKRHVLSYHKNDEPYACSICGKKFRVLVYLKSHEVTHSQDRPFQCEACGAMFKRKSDLRSHRRVHSSEKPYACKVCRTNFKTANDLKAHMLIHNDTKPHICSQCGASFKRSGHLNRHVKIHTKSKPFKCEQCGAQFNRRENLRSHQRIHSGEYPYNCKVCNAAFRHLSSMKMHEKSHLTGKVREQESGEEESQKQGIMLHLLTPAADTRLPVHTAMPAGVGVVEEGEGVESLHLTQARQGVTPISFQVSSTGLQELTAAAQGTSASPQDISINLVSLATGTLSHPVHSASPATELPTVPPSHHHHHPYHHQQHQQQPSPGSAGLLSLNTTQALAQVQAEAQAQIQAHLHSQVVPLRLATTLPQGHPTSQQHQHHHIAAGQQATHALVSGTIPTVAVQASTQFLLP